MKVKSIQCVPTRTERGANGTSHYVARPEGPDASSHSWSVYFRLESGTVDHVTDLHCRKAAFTYARKLAKTHKVEIERLPWMEPEDFGKQFEKVPCRYGAPMGRREDRTYDGTSPVRCFKVKLECGDYDDGGAYWGGAPSLPLYHARGGGLFMFTRARSREEAKKAFEAALCTKIKWR